MKKKKENQKPEHKLLTKEQFRAVLTEYLELLDEFDYQLMHTARKLKAIRYHVDEGMKEHAELFRKMYEEHQKQKGQEKK